MSFEIKNFSFTFLVIFFWKKLALGVFIIKEHFFNFLGKLRF